VWNTCGIIPKKTHGCTSSKDFNSILSKGVEYLWLCDISVFHFCINLQTFLHFCFFLSGWGAECTLMRNQINFLICWQMAAMKQRVKHVKGSEYFPYPLSINYFCKGNKTPIPWAMAELCLLSSETLALFKQDTFSFNIFTQDFSYLLTISLQPAAALISAFRFLMAWGGIVSLTSLSINQPLIVPLQRFHASDKNK